MAKLKDFEGVWTVGEVAVNGRRISPLGDPEPVINPGDQIYFARRGNDTLVCDLDVIRGEKKAPSYWNGVELKHDGDVLIGKLHAEDHEHEVTIRRFEIAQRGAVMSGIECRYSDPGEHDHLTHNGVWHAPD